MDFYTLDQLVMQWLTGVLVLILCILKRGEFSSQIITKLGSSFSTVAFVIVVVSSSIFFFLLVFICVYCTEVQIIYNIKNAVTFLENISRLLVTQSFTLQAACTILAMVATIPLAQLLFFHVLLIKKVSCSSCLTEEALDNIIY
jgi:palmitoyltransferase ZDHHC1/11